MILFVKYIENKWKRENIENFSILPCNRYIEGLKYTKIFMICFKKPFWMYFKYRIVHNGKGYKYFICLNKEIIGCFTLEVVQNKYLFLYDFALLSKYRGNGYSKKILKMIYREVRILHFRNLYLTVRDGNNIALNLYRKEGFQEIKELK